MLDVGVLRGGGAADTLINITRGDGNSLSTVRNLSCISRFDGPPEKLVIDLRGGEYVALGTQTMVALSRAKDEILKVVPGCEAEAKKTGDIIEATAGINKTIGQQALDELFQEGSLQRIQGKDRGRPFFYWKPMPVINESSFDSVTYRERVVTETNNPISVFD